MNPNQMAANPRAKENTQMKAIVLTNYGYAKSTCGISRRTVRFSRRPRAAPRLVVGEAGVDAGGVDTGVPEDVLEHLRWSTQARKVLR